MKKTLFQNITVLGLLAFGLVNHACKSGVDLSNIDKTAEVEMGLALPIGTMSASINDFLGSESIAQYLVVNEDGVLQFNYQYPIERPYTTIDLSHFVAGAEPSVPLYPIIGAVIIGNGQQMTIPIPATLTMNDLNTATSIPQRGRIDSMQISNASFSTTLSLEDCYIPKEFIDSVVLRLGDQFLYNGPKNIRLNFKDFDKPMEINLNDVCISMLKDNTLVPTTKAQADDNVVNTIESQIDIYMTVPDGEIIQLSTTSQIKAGLQTNVLSYNALYGYFVAGASMREQGSENIAADLNNWSKLKKCTLMLAKPRINLVATTKFVAPLSIIINEMSVTSADGTTEKAHFDEGDHKTWRYITDDIYKRQIKKPLNTAYTDSLLMTEDEALGDLDRLFRVSPDSLHYDFTIDIDYDNRHLQHRLTPDANINLDTKLYIPLSFGKGMELNYTDTMKDMSIKLNLDSLTNDLQFIDSVKASDIKLRVRAESTIPIDIKVALAFLDSLDQPIDLSGLIDNDTIFIKAPTELMAGGVVNQDRPGVAETLITVSKEEFDKLAQVRSIVYDATLMTNNKAMDNADGGAGTKSVAIRPSSGLKLNIGASADIDALLNLDFGNKGNNNQ